MREKVVKLKMKKQRKRNVRRLNLMFEFYLN